MGLMRIGVFSFAILLSMTLLANAKGKDTRRLEVSAMYNLGVGALHIGDIKFVGHHDVGLEMEFPHIFDELGLFGNLQFILSRAIYSVDGVLYRTSARTFLLDYTLGIKLPVFSKDRVVVEILSGFTGYILDSFFDDTGYGFIAGGDLEMELVESLVMGARLLEGFFQRNRSNESNTMDGWTRRFEIWLGSSNREITIRAGFGYISYEDLIFTALFIKVTKSFGP